MFMLLLFEWLLRSEVIVASLVPLVLISLSFHHILVIRLRCKQVESIESGYVLVWRSVFWLFDGHVSKGGVHGMSRCSIRVVN